MACRTGGPGNWVEDRDMEGRRRSPADSCPRYDHDWNEPSGPVSDGSIGLPKPGKSPSSRSRRRSKSRLAPGISVPKEADQAVQVGSAACVAVAAVIAAFTAAIAATALSLTLAAATADLAAAAANQGFEIGSPRAKASAD